MERYDIFVMGGGFCVGDRKERKMISPVYKSYAQAIKQLRKVRLGLRLVVNNGQTASMARLERTKET